MKKSKKNYIQKGSKGYHLKTFTFYKVVELPQLVILSIYYRDGEYNY